MVLEILGGGPEGLKIRCACGAQGEVPLDVETGPEGLRYSPSGLHASQTESLLLLRCERCGAKALRPRP